MRIAKLDQRTKNDSRWTINYGPSTIDYGLTYNLQLITYNSNAPLMDELTLPYHLIIPTIICMVGLGAIIFYRKRLFAKNKLLWTSMTVFLILYLFIVGSATYHAIYYQWDLNRYDLDKDGMFGGKEITLKQTEAMQRLSSDTGRNFSFISGFIFALAISTTVYLSASIISKVKRQ